MESLLKKFFAVFLSGRSSAGFRRFRAVCGFILCLGVGFFTPAVSAQISTDLTNALRVEFVKPPISQIAESTFLFVTVNRDPALVQHVGFTVRSTTQIWEYSGDYVKELGLYKFYWDLTNFHNTSYGISARVEMKDGTTALAEIFLAVVRPTGTTDTSAGNSGEPSDDIRTGGSTSTSGGVAGAPVAGATTTTSTLSNLPPTITPQLDITAPSDSTQVQGSVRLVAKGTVEFDTVMFVIDNPATALSPDLILSGFPVSNEIRTWESAFVATTVAPGDYVTRVRGQYAGAMVAGTKSVKIVVVSSEKTISSPLAIKFINAPPSPLSSSRYLFIQPNIPLTDIASLQFYVKGENMARVYFGIPLPEVGVYQFYWNLNDYIDGGYAITAVAEGVDQQRATAELYLTVARMAGSGSPLTNTPESSRSNIVEPGEKTVPEYSPPTTTLEPPISAGLPSKVVPPPPFGSATFGIQPATPIETVSAPDVSQPMVPPEATGEMPSTIEQPKLCVDADLHNPSGCQRYVFMQSFAATTSTSTEKLLSLSDCQSANGRLEVCLQMVRQKFFPEECLRQNIQDAAACYRYLQVLQTPAVCAGLDSAHCDQFLQEKIVALECQRVGALEPDVCASYFEQYIINRVNCSTGMGDCRTHAQDNLGRVVYEHRRLAEMQQVIAPQIEKVMVLQPSNQKSSPAGMAITAVEQAVPMVVASLTSVRFIPSTAGVVIRDDNTVAAMAPAVLVIDSDGDGLPDDVEDRLGTDPARPDTDGDGYTDAQEVENRHNPLGSGAAGVAVMPVERALASRKNLEQPLTVPQASADWVVSGLRNVPAAANSSGSTSAVQITGRGIPGEVVTLFVYSSLPLVMTTRVNEDGNWTYTLKQSLVDGPHEVYVAVNDETGKVVARSSPLAFLVREARAASPAELFAPAPLASPVFNWGRIYLPLSIAVIIIGVMLFLIAYNLTRRHP